MQASSSMKAPNTGPSIMTLLQAFVAGFIAVPIFHQILLWILNVTHVVPFPAFDMSPTWPLGVPAWISASFWGGVWGIIFVLTIPRLFRGASYWIAAVVASALALTLVFAFVVIPLKTGGFLGIKDFIGLMIIGSLLNGAWGIGTALFLKLFDQLLGTRPAMS